jgi:hypothetical protein
VIEEGVIVAVEAEWMHAVGEGLSAVVEEYAAPEAKIRAVLAVVGVSLRGVLRQYTLGKQVQATPRSEYGELLAIQHAVGSSQACSSAMGGSSSPKAAISNHNASHMT